MKRKKKRKDKLQVGRWIVFSILTAIVLAASIGSAIVAYHAAYSLKVRGGPHGHVVARGDTIEGSARSLGFYCGAVAFAFVLVGGVSLITRIVFPEALKKKDDRPKSPHPAERNED